MSMTAEELETAVREVRKRDNWERIFGPKPQPEKIEAPGRAIHGLPKQSPALGVMGRDGT